MEGIYLGKMLTKYIDKKDVSIRVNQLAESISSKYNIDDEIVVLCIMNGSFIFCSDLIRKIKQDVVFDSIRLSSYKDKSRGKIEHISDIKESIEGRHVLIVEDIVDTGNTINYLHKYLRKFNPESLRIVSFLFKPKIYKFDIKIDWVGFEIDDNFVVGYGLDYNARYRDKESVYKIIDNE